mgnify:CR=1 FL=1
MAPPASTLSETKGNLIRRFDGVDTDGKRRKRWERWAKSYLKSSGIPKEQWANKLLTFLDASAEKACEELDPDKIEYEGAEREVFDKLRESSPDREETDDISEKAGELFLFKPERAERPGPLEGQFKLVVKRAEDAGLTLSPKFQGWLLLTLCRRVVD